MKRFGLLGAVVVATIAGLYGMHTIGQVRAAGSASVSLSPGSSTYTINDTIVTTISVNPNGVAASGADVTIAFDSAKLSYQGMTQYSTPLDAALTATTGSGTVRVARGTFGAGSSTNFNLYQVTFRAIGTGVANVQITGGTHILSGVDGSNMWNGSQTSVNYTINPVPTPTPTPTPTATPTPGGGGSTPTPTPTPTSSGGGGGGGSTPTPTSSGGGGGSTPTPTTSGGGGIPTVTPTPQQETPGYGELVSKPPKIKINKTKKLVLNTETSRPVSARMEFGLDGEPSLATEQTPFSQSPDVEIEQKYLVPGRTYTYKMILTDEEGKIYESSFGTFRARGFKVKFTVKDAKGNLVTNTDVKLHSEERSGKTDESGTVTFEDVEEGAHKLNFTYKGDDYDLPVSVTANAETDAAGEELIPLQEQTVVAVASKSNMLMPIGAGAIGLLVLGGGVILGMRTIRQRQFANAHNVPTVAQGAIPTSPATSYEDDAYIKPTVIKPGGARGASSDSDSMMARPGDSIRPNQSNDDR